MMYTNGKYRSSSGLSKASTPFLSSVVVVALVVCMMVSGQFKKCTQALGSMSTPASASPINAMFLEKTSKDPEWASDNARKVQEWRNSLKKAIGKENTDRIKDLTKDAFRVWPNHEYDEVVFPCEYTFLDFGANVGDSLRKFIDAGFPTLNDTHPILDVTTGQVGKNCYDCGNELDKWILPKFVQENLKGKQPEDYCFYGIEGNPRFKSLLRQTEANVMNMDPRPVRHMHFFTEHVGTGKDGPTILYLDTVNEDKNFWGSSILQTYRDVKKSGAKEAVPVTGITMATLLRKTVLPGGHVIIKIDIEGGEYPLLEAAVKSKVFCEHTKNKGSVSMLLEPHDGVKIGSPDTVQHWEEIQGEQKLRDCGVSLLTQAHGA